MVEGFRLSPQQRGLWRHVQRDGPEPYCARLAALIRGPLEPATLRAALDRAVARHEILRTHFHLLPGVKLPVQVIGDPGPVPFERIEGPSTGSGPGSVEQALERAIAAHARRAAEPPEQLRASWIACGPELGALLLELPPGRVDAAALELLLAEVLADCAGARHEVPAVSAAEEAGDEGPLQYADLAEWQNELLEGDEGREGLAAWRRARLPARPPVDLPIVQSERPEHPAPRMEIDELILEPAAAEALAAAAAALELPPEHLVLAAWLVLLWRRSGQEERLLGVGFDGRGYEELGSAVGLFERELPVALEVRPEESGAELARRVGARLAELALRQETFAWERAVDGATAEPALPIGFGVDDRRREHAAGALRARVLRRVARTQPAVLRAVFAPSPGTTVIELHRDLLRVPAADGERLGAELLAAISALAAQPGRPVGELELLSAALRAEALAPGLAAPRPDYPRAATIHELIQAQAAARPQAPALVHGARALSYGELDRRARVVARRLRELGVTPDQRVALCCERSPEMFVGLLGVLAAGAGYVPIDPAYPTERIAFMLSDAACPVLLTHARLEQQLGRVARSAGGATRVLALEGLDGPDEGPLPPLAGPEHLAYVIYTSGSTGTPKGVEVCHQSLVHSTAARAVVYGRDPRRYLLLSSYAFDSSVAGIFWTLTTGGALIVPEEGSERDVRELARLIEAQRVTTTLALPSLWNLLLDHGGLERLASLETVVVAGEACPRELASKHRRLLPACLLVNEYGPTEGTVWSTSFDCAELGPEGPVPIGRPIPRTSAYLLDERRRPVPLGAPGELWIGGEGLARAYLGRPELTAERFVPDPFLQGTAAGSVPVGAPARMYRTGDLARWLASGELEFLGRVDHQVKVRGYRVELGEIEDALTAHALVAEAAAVAREDSPGDQRLVAYVTAAGDTPPEPAALAELLRARLPEYMVPQVFVVLEALPRTPNGKLDRAALPAPEASRSSLTAAYLAPGTPLEQAFCDVWAEVLDVPRVGLADDFFELGGHSILAVRLAARLAETLGVEVGLRALFAAPTVAGLLAALAADPALAPGLHTAAELLAQVEGLSEEQVEAALAEQGTLPPARETGR